MTLTIDKFGAIKLSPTCSEERALMEAWFNQLPSFTDEQFFAMGDTYATIEVRFTKKEER